MTEVRHLTCSDGHVLAYRAWIPETRTVAALHILHGMAEHSKRYGRFAEYLNSKGIAVYAQDHRGHGLTATEANEPLGYFGAQDGWARIAEDAHELSLVISEGLSGVPLFLMGHSMGSFLARTVMVKWPDLYSGVIIMGTGASMGLKGKMGKLLAKSEARKNGPAKPTELMDRMTFSAYNKPFEPADTSFDWLSRDAGEVKLYIDDPLCGFVCTGEFFYDLLSGIEYANSQANADKVPKDLPLLIISGSMDPVGAMSKGVRKVDSLYRNAGVTDVQLVLVDGGRHEILNETDRSKTFRILSDWMLSH